MIPVDALSLDAPLDVVIGVEHVSEDTLGHHLSSRVVLIPEERIDTTVSSLI